MSDLAGPLPILASASSRSNADFTQSNGTFCSVWARISRIDVSTSHLASKKHFGTTVARIFIVNAMRDGEEGLRVTIPHKVCISTAYITVE